MSHRQQGFTLIELMIVVAIIAIIAAIAIPGLLRSRIAANEVSCQSCLKQFVSTEGVWRQTDADRNGVQDYWTRDVCGFYGVTDASTNLLKLIDIAIAKADRNNVGDYPVVGPAFARSGYYFSVMSLNENGSAYQQQLGSSPGAYTNLSIFAFCGYPQLYNNSGVRVFIVNQQGVLYQRDMGTSTAVVTWPSSDPSTLGWAQAN